ncbi:MAG: hypothetical protein V4479_13455 [Actinomycetota bacterium]
MKTRNILVSVTTLGIAALLAATGLSPAQEAAASAAAVDINKYTSALTTSGGFVHFDTAAAIALGGNPSLVEQVAVGIEATGGVVSGMAVPTRQVLALKSTVAAVAHCLGSNSFSHQWFGYRLKLNSCNVSRVLAVGASITTVAGIIAGILGPTVIGGALALAATAIVGLGSATLLWCSSNGNGSIIDFGPGVVWCANQ